MDFRDTAEALSRPLKFGDIEQKRAVAFAHRFDEALQAFRAGRDTLHEAIKDDRASQPLRDAWALYLLDRERRQGVPLGSAAEVESERTCGDDLSAERARTAPGFRRPNACDGRRH